MKNHLKLTAPIVSLSIVAGLICIPTISSNAAMAQKSDQLPTRRSSRIKPVSEGPLKQDRMGVRNWLMQAKKRGVGIKGYLSVYNDMESAVKSGQSEEVIKQKLERIHQSIGDQYQASKKLQSPHRKLSTQRSPYRDTKRGKVDLTFGSQRYGTPHEVRQTCEEAERQAIRNLPPEWRNNLAVRQDLRRQRDEREYAMNRRLNFKDRGFMKNPYRHKKINEFSRHGYGRSFSR